MSKIDEFPSIQADQRNITMDTHTSFRPSALFSPGRVINRLFYVFKVRHSGLGCHETASKQVRHMKRSRESRRLSDSIGGGSGKKVSKKVKRGGVLLNISNIADEKQ